MRNGNDKHFDEVRTNTNERGEFVLIHPAEAPAFWERAVRGYGSDNEFVWWFNSEICFQDGDTITKAGKIYSVRQTATMPFPNGERGVHVKTKMIPGNLPLVRCGKLAAVKQPSSVLIVSGELDDLRYAIIVMQRNRIVNQRQLVRNGQEAVQFLKSNPRPALVLLPFDQMEFKNELNMFAPVLELTHLENLTKERNFFGIPYKRGIGGFCLG
jgi:hypothetical protein